MGEGGVKNSDIDSDSSAEFFASSGYHKLEKKLPKIKQKSIDASGNVVKEENRSDSDPEYDSNDDSEDDLTHQAPLITSFNDDSHSNSDQSDQGPPHFTASVAGSNRYPIVVVHRDTFNNPFRTKSYMNRDESLDIFGDAAFKNAPFPRINWECVFNRSNCSESFVSCYDGQLSEAVDAMRDQDVFANAPWTFEVVPKLDSIEMDLQGEEIFEKAPLGALSLIIPLISEF